MRLRHALVAIAALSALVLIACGGGDGDAPDTTSTLPPPTATTTAAPLVDVPGRPNAFADYPGVVGIYLTVAGPAVLGAPCLTELIDEWGMAEPDGVPLMPEERCLVGNTDIDTDEEVVVLFTVESDDGFGLLSNVVVFDSTPDGYVAVFESWTPDQVSELNPQRIVVAEDITGDGNGDLVYTSTACGASTCTLAVHVATGDGDVYSELTPEDGIFMATADLAFEESREGGTLLVLTGGFFGSVGAGPQRERREVYAWDGAAFALRNTENDPTHMLYFHVVDADAVFDDGNYGIAAQRYRDALADDGLGETGFHENELDELGAYAIFRIALSQIIAGESEADALAALEQGLVDYAGTVNAGLIDAFQQGYAASGNYQGGCLAVTEQINANLDAFLGVWEYGYANPPFEPERVCPF